MKKAAIDCLVSFADAAAVAGLAQGIASDLGFSRDGWERRRLTFTSTYAADIVLLTDPDCFPPPRMGEHDGSIRAIVTIRNYVRNVGYTPRKARALAIEAQEAAAAQGLSQIEWERRRLCFTSEIEASLTYLADPTYLPPPVIATAA